MAPSRQKCHNLWHKLIPDQPFLFELRDKETIDPDQNRWERCSRVLARRDVVERLSVPW
jgi:hypothetical protein